LSFDSIRSAKFGTGKRQSLGNTSFSPAPGEHNPDFSKVKRSAPKFGFGSGNRDSGENIKAKNFPGPGNYQLKPLVGNEGLKSSMHRTIDYKPENKEQSYKPGPGNYNPNINASIRAEPAYKLGTSSRIDLQSSKIASF
jgi:hypothetical protein